jgi:hypothetical protein
VITANDDVLKAKPSDKKSVKIINTVNKDSDVKGDFEYESMTDIIKDNKFLDNIVTKHGDAD